MDRNIEGPTRSRSRFRWANFIDLLDPLPVPPTLKFGFQPDVDDLECQILRQQALAQGQDIGIIVRAGQAG